MQASEQHYGYAVARVRLITGAEDAHWCATRGQWVPPGDGTRWLTRTAAQSFAVRLFDRVPLPRWSMVDVQRVHTPEVLRPDAEGYPRIEGFATMADWWAAVEAWEGRR